MTVDSLNSSITNILQQMRELYSSQFEQNLYALFIDRFPLNSSDYHDIRITLNLKSPTLTDVPMINRGLAFLETYVHCFRDIVVPNISNPLNYSQFKKISGPVKNELQLKLKMATYVLPLNIKRMLDLIENLKQQLPETPKSQIYSRKQLFDHVQRLR